MVGPGLVRSIAHSCAGLSSAGYGGGRRDGSRLAQSAVIKCRWASGATWSEVGPETGEDLDAQTWTDGRIKVTVGLPDYENATTYRREGFEVAISSVAGRQGHFICAWGPDSPDDISTWFAVDWPTARLIAPEAEPNVAPDCGGMS
jgi:hypothetical protein